MEVKDPLLSEFADDPEMRELLIEYAANLQETKDQLRGYFSVKDHEKLRRTLHQLKGSGGGYGFPILSEKAGSLEERLRQNYSIESLDDQFSNDLESLIEWIDAAIAGCPTS